MKRALLFLSLLAATGASAADTDVLIWQRDSATTGLYRTITGSSNTGEVLSFDGSGVIVSSPRGTPLTSDGEALGSATVMWSDLFLASGAVINFNNGDVVLTHSANSLAVTGGTFAAGSSILTTIETETLNILDNVNQDAALQIIAGSDLSVARTLTFLTGDATRSITLNGNTTLNDWFDQSVKVAASPQFTGIELSHASANTLTASGGELSIEGTQLAKVAGNIGAATATTPAANDNDTSVATSAFVQTEIADLLNGDITIVVGNGTDVISTGVQGYIRIPTARTITACEMVASDSAVTGGAIVVDIWEDSYANYPPTNADSMTDGGTSPTITATNTKSQPAITSWDTAIAAGNYIGVNVDSVTSMKRVTITIKCTKP